MQTITHMSREPKVFGPSCLIELSNLPGAIGVVLMDLQSNHILALIGQDPKLDIDAAMHADFLKSRLDIMARFDPGDAMEDILISNSRRYHIVRSIGGRNGKMLYMCLERGAANVVLTRMRMAQAEAELLL